VASGPRARVLIIGGGFGGLTAAQSLRRAPVEVTLVDRLNHHLFQPLLYQVAMAGLAPTEIASPIRTILRKQKNVTVLLGEVISIDLLRKQAVVRGESDRVMSYDYLIIAAGARTNYFGHDDWSKHALGLKDLDEAVEIRRRVLVAFEAAEFESDSVRRKGLLTFVVIGGGPTGVELAGALAELSRHVLARDFRVIDPSHTRVILIEGGPRILGAFDPVLSERAAAQLKSLGVEVRLGAPVKNIDELGVHLDEETIASTTIIWAAGVKAAPITAGLGVDLDRAGRIVVAEDCSIPGHREAFAIGDIAALEGKDGKPLPGVSPVAMQQARFVAQMIERSIGNQPRRRFEYWDKGMMATIGRSRAVAETMGLKLSGFIAWLAWLFVHLFYLIGFRNRFLVLFDWFWAYVLYRRGARLITGKVIGTPKRAELAATAPSEPAAHSAAQPRS
jgi:NADH:quinone reductase (non-electrogenic)